MSNVQARSSCWRRAERGRATSRATSCTPGTASLRLVALGGETLDKQLWVTFGVFVNAAFWFKFAKGQLVAPLPPLPPLRLLSDGRRMQETHEAAPGWKNTPGTPQKSQALGAPSKMKPGLVFSEIFPKLLPLGRREGLTSPPHRARVPPSEHKLGGTGVR